MPSSSSHSLRRRRAFPALLLVLVLPLAGGAPPEVSGAPPSVGSPFPADVLEARRERLIAALDGRPAVITGAAHEGLPWDVPRDLVHNEDFFYLTGLEVPNGWLLLNAPAPGDVVLYLRPVPGRARTWVSAVPGPGERTRELTGVAEVRSAEALEAGLADLFRAAEGGMVLASTGDREHRRSLEGLGAPAGVEVGDLAPLVAALRLVKDPGEIARIRRAVEITGEAVREGARVTAPGIHEYEIEAAVEYVFRSRGARGPSFPSILGSGPNSVVLHYGENTRRTRPGDLLVMDVGAEYEHYAADVTRTLPVSGRFTERQRAVYELVLGAQGAALERVRPGATISELERAARDYMRTHSGDLCGEGSCVRYFAHGLSHWLGLEVHDVGSYATPLEAGMVLTVEPGIYIPEEELGVRIEDDVLVTRDGHEVLSGFVPRDPDEVETLMKEAPRWIRPTPGAGG